MLILFAKSQFNLFDAPVNVAAHVRRDGTVVKPHVRIQKVAVQRSLFDDHHAAAKPQAKPKRTKLDVFIERKGGLRALGSVISQMSHDQQLAIFAQMGKLDGKSPEDVAAMFADHYDKAPAKGETPDLFSQPDEPEKSVHAEKKTVQKPAPSAKPITAKPPKLDLPTVEHDGDTWHVLSTGARRDDGKVMAHLSSTTRGTHAKNGVHPVQVQDYIDPPANEDAPAAKEQAKTEEPDSAPPRPMIQESQQDAAHREWRENYDRIVNLSGKDLVREGTKDLERAEAYGERKIAAELQAGWDGGKVNQALIDSMQVDVDVIKAELKRRREKREAKGKPVKAKAETPAPTPKTTPAPAPAIPHDPTAPFGVKAGTTKARRRDINAGVSARLAEGGPYTAEDLAQFRQYSGNGGCGDSLNEFYTDPGVARGMWAALRSLGFEHGTALEPSCATGVFLHTAPAGVRVTGVEMDPTSAGVAHALHGDRHEIITASFERFATTDDRQFDVVIGNPPYGPRGGMVRDDKKDIADAERYFTDTALDKAKPGGLVALVVPTGIMDSKSGRGFREDMLRKGQFLGAQRMPNTAFEHSHTEVTTDVIFLRKRPDDVAGALGTVGQDVLQKLGVWDEEFLAGTYFTGRGAGNVLGTMTEGWRAKAGMGNDITVEGSMDGVADAVANFTPDPETPGPGDITMAQVLEALGDDEAARDRAVSAGFRRPYANTAKVGDTKTVDGVTYILQGEPPRWHRLDEFLQNDAISEATALAADIDTLMTGSGAVNRPELEARIRAYVEKHGVPADDPNLMTAAAVDKRLFRLVGAVNRKGELSDTVLGKVPAKLEGGFDAVAQVLSLEHDGGAFTSSELAERLDKPLDEVVDQLTADKRYAYLGAGKWTTMSAYLTGELWPKLDAAKAALEAGAEPDLADKRRLQVERLEEAIGAKSLDEVDFQMNSAFIPTHVLAAYLNWRQYESGHANEWTKKQAPVEINFDGGVYSVTGGNTYGDTKLIDKYLNRTGIRKEKDKPSIDAMNDEFKSWLCGSSYRDAVEDTYNRTFRGFVAPEYSDEPIDVPGLATDRTVRNWRWSSLRRSLATGKGIVADDVGLGKTLGGLLLARMAKVQGSAQRPIIVVPKSVLANWYSETQVWFPGSKVLTIGANFAQGKTGGLVGKDDDEVERKRKYHDMTQNEYDFILISEPAFEEVDLDPVTKEEYYSSDFWVQRGEALGNAGDKRRKAIRERYEQHIAQREFSDRTDAIYFNELGVDMLIADEMHHQKNLYSARARFGENPKFLGGQGLSNRALDFNLKTRWVREKNGGKGVHGLTATPTKNSPLEIYSMLSHIAPEAFERIKVRNSEEFLDRFCEFAEDKVLSTKGDIEDSLVVTGFKNLDELRDIMGRFIDRRTAEQVGLKLPERDDRMHLVDMSKAQQDVYAELRELAEESAGKKDATGDAHIFAIMDKMNKAALDLSLLDPAKYAGATSPKYAELARQCVEGAKEGGQIVFCEYIDSHDKIVAALVDAGFKRSEIGVINAQVASSSVKRQNIAEALNAGKLKVVVGNATMAEGLNMQKTTTDIHHMDVPWEPATLQQRNGRGLRQGNMNKSLRIHTYLSRGSFDGYRYQAVAAKKDWQDLLWNGGDRVDNLSREGNFSLDEMRIMLSADPEEARKQFEGDKAAAIQRHETGQRQEAQAVFVRFREMSRSYAGLKNKNTASGERLRRTMESLKTSLFNNKYWPAKAALSNNDDVLIHPQTGTVLTKDVGLDFGKDGKMVVTGVDMKAGKVSMRRYAATSGSHNITVPMSELADGKPFAFDAGAEADEVGKAMAEQAEAAMNNLTKWDEVKAMPSAVLERNHDLIQKQIKEGMKSYKFSMGHGSVPMVNKETGELKMAESYEHTKLHDTHDYLLPTDAAKEKVVQAWMAAERTKKFGKTTYQARKNSRTEWRNRAEYKGARYDQKQRNPWTSVLADMGDGRRSVIANEASIVRDTRDRFHAEQLERVRNAPSFKDAVAEAIPTAHLPEYGSVEKPTWNKDVTAALWERAQRDGVLNSPMDDHVPKGTIGAGERLYPVHDKYAFHLNGWQGEDQSVRAALRNIAQGSALTDLYETIKQHGAAKEAA